MVGSVRGASVREKNITKITRKVKNSPKRFLGSAPRGLIFNSVSNFGREGPKNSPGGIEGVATLNCQKTLELKKREGVPEVGPGTKPLKALRRYRASGPKITLQNGNNPKG